MRAIATDDNGRAVETLHDARGDYADYPDVPRFFAFNDDEVVFGIEA